MIDDIMNLTDDLMREGLKQGKDNLLTLVGLMPKALMTSPIWLASMLLSPTLSNRLNPSFISLAAKYVWVIFMEFPYWIVNEEHHNEKLAYMKL